MSEAIKRLLVDRELLAGIFDALFLYADSGTWLRIRGFDQKEKGIPPVEDTPIKINHTNREGLIDVVVEAAQRCVDHKVPAVFAPIIATFKNAHNARTANLANGLTISVELDEAPEEALRVLRRILGPPTVITYSGSLWEGQRKCHAHWRLSKPTRTPAEHEMLQYARNLTALVTKVDESGMTIVHPYRWPGSWNMKGTPVLATAEIIKGATVNLEEVIRDLEAACQQLGVSLTPDTPHRVSNAPQASSGTVADTLASIPNRGAIIYDKWVKVGYACYAELGSDGFDLFNEWSRQSDKYNEKTTTTFWKYTAKSNPDRISIGTLILYAQQAQAAVRLQTICDPPKYPPNVSPDRGKFSVTAAMSTGILRARELALLRYRIMLENTEGPAVLKTTPGLTKEPIVDLPIYTRYLAGQSSTEPFQMLIAGPTAVGKTGTVIELLVQHFIRTQFETPKPRILYISLTHHQADEFLSRLTAARDNSGLTDDDMPIIIHRGLDRPDPTDPTKKMCWRDETTIEKARLAGASHITTLCALKSSNPCPHPCAWTPQRRAQYPHHGVFIFVGDMALTQKPYHAASRPLQPAFDLIIADETKLFSWMYEPNPIDLGTLHPPSEPFGNAKAHVDAGADRVFITEALDALRNILDPLPKGKPLTAETIRAITNLADWKVVRNKMLRFKAKAEDHIKADDDPKIIQETLEAIAAYNSPITRTNTLIRTLAFAEQALIDSDPETESGNITLANTNVLPKAIGTVIELINPKAIHKAYKETPIMLLDATTDANKLKYWFPDLEVAADDFRLTIPKHVHITQIHDDEFPYSKWVPDKDDPKSKADKIKIIVRQLVILADKFKGQGRDGIDVLAVMPKRMEEAVKEAIQKANLPFDRVAIEHFHNIRGIDKYSGVRCLLVVSRPMPAQWPMEKKTFALTGKIGKRLDARNVPKERPKTGAYEMRDGTGRPAFQRLHPDPDVEATKWLMCHAEVIQVIGRPRYAHRTEANPLDVIILTNIPLPISIDTLLARNEWLQSVSTEMYLLALGIVPVPQTKGFNQLMAMIEGKTVKAIEREIEKGERFAGLTAFIDQGVPADWHLFKVKLPGVRYAVPAWIRGDDPLATLRRAGVTGAEIVAVSKTRSTPPKPSIEEEAGKEGVTPNRDGGG